MCVVHALGGSQSGRTVQAFSAINTVCYYRLLLSQSGQLCTAVRARIEDEVAAAKRGQSSCLVSERSVSELELRLRVLCYALHDEQSASRPQPDQRCDASARSSGCSRTCCSAEQLKAHHESARASRQQQSVRSSPIVRSFAPQTDGFAE